MKMSIAEVLLRIMASVVVVVLILGLYSIALTWKAHGQEAACRMIDRWFGWNDDKRRK